MKKLRIKLFGKPKKSFFFLSTGNTKKDIKKYNELKSKHRTFKIMHICPLDKKIQARQYFTFQKRFLSLDNNLNKCNSLQEQKSLLFKYYIKTRFPRETLIKRLNGLKFEIEFNNKHIIKDILFLIYIPCLIAIITNLCLSGFKDTDVLWGFAGCSLLLYFGLKYGLHRLDLWNVKYFHLYEIRLFEIKLLKSILKNRCFLRVGITQR